MNFTLYAVIGLLTGYADALLCFALKRRYRLLRSLICCALWPLFVPLVMIGAAVLTRGCPPTSTPLSPTPEAPQK